MLCLLVLQYNKTKVVNTCNCCSFLLYLKKMTKFFKKWQEQRRTHSKIHRKGVSLFSNIVLQAKAYSLNTKLFEQSELIGLSNTLLLLSYHHTSIKLYKSLLLLHFNGRPTFLGKNSKSKINHKLYKR